MIYKGGNAKRALHRLSVLGMLLSKIQKTVIAAHAVKSQYLAEYPLKYTGIAADSTPDSIVTESVCVSVPMMTSPRMMTHQNTLDMDVQMDSENLQDTTTTTTTRNLDSSSVQPSPFPPLPLYISSESPTNITEENSSSPSNNSNLNSNNLNLNNLNLNLNLYGPHTSPGVSPPSVDADRALGMFSISGKYKD